MQEGALSRYQMHTTPRESRVDRETQNACAALWGQQAPPKVSWQWKLEDEAVQDSLLLRGRARTGDEALLYFRSLMPMFVEQVDGTSGARAFFDAIAPQLEALDQFRGGRKRRRQAEEDA